MLTLAQRTPSWCNTQPWAVTVTSGEATRALRAAMTDPAAPTDTDVPFPAGYEGVYRARRRESGHQLYAALRVARGDRETAAREAMPNFELFGAPHVAVVSVPTSLGPYAYLDCGLYVHAFLLAAQALGIATVAQAIAMCSRLLHDLLGIGEDRDILCGISFGYPEEDHPSAGFRTSRAPLEDVVTWVDGGFPA